MTITRSLAASVINAVTQGQSLTALLDANLSQLTNTQDKAFVQALCYGVCRYYIRLEALLSYLLEKPMKAKDSDLHALLLVGLYQLMAMRIPDYAAVTETVNAAAKLNKTWAKGLVNAVLRRYLRDKVSLEEKLNAELESQYAHPLWLITKIKKTYPHEWQTLLTANNAHPPFSLRVNQCKQAREAYKKKLISEESAITDIPFTASGIIVTPALSVEELPGFKQGEVSVQDGAAQLAAEWLDLKPNLRVLDACAAPGGKLAHILELQPNLTQVVAVEKDPERILSIKDNLARLKLSAEIHCADAGTVNTWWDGKLFDRILLDAPCSASGVIRRHPDIKLLRQESDITQLAKEQARLLRALWPLLAQGGLLLYVTCSIFSDENEQILKEFLKECSDAIEDKIGETVGHHQEVGLQILPGEQNMDGFYYARLKKIPVA